MGDGADVEILLKWKEENAAAHAEVMRKLGEMTAAQTAANAATVQWYSPLQALVAVLPGWVAGVAGAAGVLAPFTALVLSAAVAMVSFAAGAAGFIALSGGIAAGFAAIAAGVIALGLSKGGIADARNEFQELTQDLDKMRVVLEKQAAPLAATIAQWAGQAIPWIRDFGQEIMKWFGDRLIGVLTTIKSVLVDLIPSFVSFGRYLGQIADWFGPQIARMVEGGIRDVMIPAVEGLIYNLARLADWFRKEAPTLGPIVQQIFGGIGSVIQFVADHWARFNDWIVKNWKPTLDEAKKDWDKIAAGWKGVDFSGLVNALSGLGGAIKGVGDIAAIVLGAVGGFIKALQEWANNQAFWNGLTEKIIALGRAIGAFLDNVDRMTGQAPSGTQYLPHGSGGGAGGGGGGVSTWGARAGQRGPSTMNNVFHIQGYGDPEATARAVSRQMRGLLAT